MNTTPSPHPYISVEEYLALEESSPIRREYVGGQLYALGGASVRHNRIIRNLVRLLSDAADAQAHRVCEVLSAEVMVRVAPELFYYPDVIVACEPGDDHPQYRTQPCVIVEVLSPSTQATDRREKVFAYRQVAALQSYIIAYQDDVRVERHYRDSEGNWSSATVFRQGMVPVPCVGLDLTLDQIYAGIDLNETE